jgi:peptide deformylase
MIKLYPTKILREKCKEVTKEELNDSDAKDLIETMRKVIIDFQAHGLAANQIGIDTRIIGIMSEGETTLRFMINPEIIEQKGTWIGPEGCLSFPNVLVDIKRSSYIKVKYIDIENKEHIEELTEREAIIVQHEIDHLNGITLMQRAPKAMRGQIMRKLTTGKRRIKKAIKHR